MRRRDFLAGIAGAAAAQTPARPNIILIVADDLGYGDLGCYGQRMFATPEIDRMAAEGIRFTQAYAGASVCAPSRCCLMTGLHSGHARVRGNKSAKGERVPLRPDDQTVAEVLKRAGYRTGIVGKWGLGEAGTIGVPNAQGFDEWYGFLNQDHALEYYPTHLWENGREIFPAGNQGAKRRDYVQDLFTERALRFIEQNKQRPFFLYLPYTVPHASSELGRDTGDGFVVPDYEPYEDRDWPRPEKGYAAMVTRLDRDVGRILAKVRDLGIETNTIVLFTSDNGPARDGGHSPEFFSSRGGLRGRKGELYEGGIRVPMIARWPGRIPAGRTSDAPWAFWDFLPTAAGLAGLPQPEGLDGRTVIPELMGGALSDRPPLYWEQGYGRQPFEQAVRLGDWKGVRRAGKLELFNLLDDPAEQHDRSGDELGVVREIESVMVAARVAAQEFPKGRPN